MSPITRKLLVGAVVAGATAGLGMSFASAQTESPPATQTPSTTQAPTPGPDGKDCPWRDGRDGGNGGNGDNGDNGGNPANPDSGGTSPSTDATSSAV